MAKNLGNTDFNLTVTKTGTKNLKIKWNKEFRGQQVVLQVFRPGDSKMILTKTFRTDEHKGDVTVTTPYFGEYYVKISTSRGAQWDAIKRWVKLSSTVTSTKTYTQTDVNNWKRDQLIVTFAFASIGLTARVTIAAAVAALSFVTSSTTIWKHDTKHEGLLAPRKGWKLRSKIESASDGVKYSLITLNSNNVQMQVKTRTAKYLKSNF